DEKVEAAVGVRVLKKLREVSGRRVITGDEFGHQMAAGGSARWLDVGCTVEVRDCGPPTGTRYGKPAPARLQVAASKDSRRIRPLHQGGGRAGVELVPVRSQDEAELGMHIGREEDETHRDTFR